MEWKQNARPAPERNAQRRPTAAVATRAAGRADAANTRLWLLIAAVAHALDLLTTFIGLDLGLREMNPLFRLLVPHGELAFFAVRVALVAVLFVSVLRFRPFYPLVWPLFQVMTALTVLTVVNNTLHILGVLS